MQNSLAPVGKPLARRRGDYGFDAPFYPLALGSCGLAGLIVGVCFILIPHWLIPGIICLIFGLLMCISTFSYVYTTRRGKFQIWAELLTQLALRGDERILDMGCGRGAVLLMAADLLSTGKATGVDLWITRDQSGNASEVTRRNAELEGVSQKVELETADMRKLPFPDNSFDLLLSSLAIHNIPGSEGRLQAIDEAIRVLKPGGQLMIADIGVARHYAEHLRTRGMDSAGYRRLDWRFWYGNPWVATYLVSARKPV